MPARRAGRGSSGALPASAVHPARPRRLRVWESSSGTSLPRRRRRSAESPGVFAAGPAACETVRRCCAPCMTCCGICCSPWAKPCSGCATDCAIWPSCCPTWLTIWPIISAPPPRPDASSPPRAARRARALDALQRLGRGPATWRRPSRRLVRTSGRPCAVTREMVLPDVAVACRVPCRGPAHRLRAALTAAAIGPCWSARPPLRAPQSPSTETGRDDLVVDLGVGPYAVGLYVQGVAAYLQSPLLTLRKSILWPHDPST